jgi:hypothetical protein
MPRVAPAEHEIATGLLARRWVDSASALASTRRLARLWTHHAAFISALR